MKASELYAKRYTARQLLDMLVTCRTYMDGAKGIRLASQRRKYFSLIAALQKKSSEEVRAAV